MAEAAKSSTRGQIKKGCCVSVDRSLFPDEECETDRIYGKLDTILPNGMYRVKWDDGYVSIMEENNVFIENDFIQNHDEKGKKKDMKANVVSHENEVMEVAVHNDEEDNSNEVPEDGIDLVVVSHENEVMEVAPNNDEEDNSNEVPEDDIDLVSQDMEEKASTKVVSHEKEVMIRKASSRGQIKKGCCVSVDRSLFPDEECETDRIYGKLDTILPNGMYRVKWDDGYVSIMEENNVFIENDFIQNHDEKGKKKDMKANVVSHENEVTEVAVHNDEEDNSNEVPEDGIDLVVVSHENEVMEVISCDDQEGQLNEVTEDNIGDEVISVGDEVHLMHGKKKIMKAILLKRKGTVKTNEAKFIIKKIFKNISTIWNKFDEDVHCVDSFIVWNMNNVVQANIVANKNYYRKEGSRQDTKIEVRSKRKRRKTKNQWNQEIRKRKRNHGEEYTMIVRGTKEVKVVPARKMGGPCNCKKLNCDNNYPQEMREKIYQHYWNLGDINLRRTFLSRCAKRHQKKRTRIRDLLKAKANARKYSIEYSLPGNGDIDDVMVCMKFLINTLGETRKALSTAIQLTDDDTGIVRTDMRGSNPKPKKDRVNVINHIKKFKAVDSHYLRKQVKKKYLPAELSIKKMYRMYQDWCKIKGKRIETYDVYYKVFKRDFNLSFYKPKKDQCGTCESYKLGDKTQEDKIKQNKHITDKDLARGIKTATKEEARENQNMCVGAFDLEKVLLSPHGECDLFYYKRRLKQMNLTVTDLIIKDVFCYFWSEDQGKKGPNEVSTGVHKFLEFQAGEGITKVHLFSDNCPGQQGNRFYFLSLSYAVRKLTLDVVTHTFLVKGHSQNINDTAHSQIEKASKGKKIYTPVQWETVIQSAFVEQNCVFNMMTFEDFMNFKTPQEYEQILKKKCFETFHTQQTKPKKIPVKWSKIVQFEFRKSSPFIMYYKYEYNQALFHEVRIGTPIARRSKDRLGMAQCYMEPKGINALKKRDLMFLCRSKKYVIPKHHHRFFEELQVSEEVSDSEASDNEQETA